MDNAKQAVTAEEVQKAEHIAQDMFNMLGVEATLRVEAKEDSIDVLLEPQESGIIIGYHGETLDSLQLILSLAVSRKLGRFVRVLIDVGEYRKQRTEYLERLAQQIKDRALRENQEQVVTALKSWERRIIHLLLQEDPEVITESQGTGRDRVLVVKPK